MEEKFDPFEERSFTYDRCFLCGNVLNSMNYSEEHVYPKWLQGKYDLWNKQLILLNNTKIKYRNLTIPCCKKCNNDMSRTIEKPIQQAVEGGYNKFIKLDKTIVFQWINKIAYGMLFKELSLKLDIRDPKSLPIYNEENLKEHRMQYMFLKSIIDKTTFTDVPFSLLVFKIKTESRNDIYWMSDNPFIKTFFIRMDDIGIIAHLMDNGFQESFFKQTTCMSELLNKELHPIQFAEMCAKVQYKSSLFYRNPYYTMIYDNDHNLKDVISHSMSGAGYKEWNQQEYARCLTFYWNKWGLKYQDIYKGNDLVITYLRNEDGTFKDMFKNDK